MKTLMIAASSLLMIPLWFAQNTAYCPRNSAGVLQPYAVESTDGGGNAVTLLFNPTAQAEYCHEIQLLGY